MLSYSKEPSRLSFPNGWYRTLPADAADENLGQTCLDALARSEDGVSEPFKREWELLGYRNNSAYLKGAQSVSLDSLPGSETVSIVPLRRAGQGFEVPSPMQRIDAPAHDAAAVGAAVRDAFTKID